MATKPAGTPGKYFEHRITSAEGRRRVAQRVQSGESIDAIAAELGISSRTVRRYSFEFAEAAG